MGEERDSKGEDKQDTYVLVLGNERKSGVAIINLKLLYIHVCTSEVSDPTIPSSTSLFSNSIKDLALRSRHLRAHMQLPDP